MHRDPPAPAGFRRPPPPDSGRAQLVHADDLLCVLGIDGWLRFANGPLRTVLEMHPGEGGRLPRVHPDDVPLLADVHAGERSVPLTIRLRKATGGWVQLDLSCQMLGVGADVRVLGASPALAARASDADRRSLANAAPIGVYVIENGLFRYANPEFERITGYAAEELVGTRAMDLVLPEDRRDLRRQAARVIAGDRWVQYAYRIRTKDGDARWISENVAPLRSAGFRATLGTCLDITERRREAQALREADHRVREAAAATPDMLVLTGPAGRFLFVNDTHIEVLGYRALDLLGLPAQALVHPEDRQAVLRAMTTWQPEEPITLTFRARRKDGAYIWLESSVEVIHDPEGKYNGAVIISRDISARRRVEEELRRIAADLRSPADALAMFAFAAAQGESAPLHLISTFAELVARKHYHVNGPDTQGFIEGLASETARFQALITDLLSVDGPEARVDPQAA